MSYNYTYEMSNESQNKKLEQSKYIYKNNEELSQIFIFELILKDKFEQHHTIRKIKKASHGNLVSLEDKIPYDFTNKFKLSVINVNNPEKPIILKNNINHILSCNTFINNEIYQWLSGDKEFALRTFRTFLSQRFIFTQRSHLREVCVVLFMDFPSRALA